MIKTETVNNLIHTWSDLGVKIHGGVPEGDYDEAYDPIDMGRTYTETDVPIEGESEDKQKAAAFDYLTGRSSGNE